ncbi:VMAP-C domain-containing protein [Longispora urticae]
MRILGADGRVCGGGVLVDHDLILTCAHVVTAALRADPGPALPRTSVRVDFPAFSGLTRQAWVAAGGWLPIAADGSGDLAVLKLQGPVPAQAAAIGAWTEVAEESVRVYGHPRQLPEGVWAHATLSGTGGPGGELVQLIGRLEGRRIERGFSGCGVMDAETGAVVGIVVAEDGSEGSRNAWMLPMELAYRLAPLAGPSGALEPARDYLDDLLHELQSVPGLDDRVNRGYLVDELERELDRRVEFTSSDHTARDLLQLLRGCLEDPDGEALDALVRALRRLYRGHPGVRRIAELAQERPLLLRPERQRLIRTLGRLGPDLVTRSVRSALGPLGVGHHLDPADVGGVVDELAELGRPLLLFLLRVAEQCDQATADELREHYARCARRLGMADREIDRLRVSEPFRPATPRRTYVVVELHEYFPNPEKYLLAVWLQHDTGDGDRPLRTGDGEPLSLAELPGKLSELLRELASASLEALGELTIEFVLPDELLSHPVDQWKVTPMGFPRELGMEYPVVVRSLERVRNSLTRGRWRRRWSWLQSNGGHISAVQWLHLGAVDQAMLLADLRISGDDHPVCLVLCGQPGTDEALKKAIAAVLEAGVPAVLWCRDDRTAKRFEDETTVMLGGREVLDLPMLVLRHRQDAVRRGRPTEHLGLHLSLLWEDAERLPPAGRR